MKVSNVQVTVWLGAEYINFQHHVADEMLHEPTYTSVDLCGLAVRDWV
jgi:hypothetical protein